MRRAAPQGDRGQGGTGREEGDCLSSAEAVPGEVASVVTVEGAGEAQGASGVAKRTCFTAEATVKAGPEPQRGGHLAPHLGGGAFGGLDPELDG